MLAKNCSIHVLNFFLIYEITEIIIEFRKIKKFQEKLICVDEQLKLKT